MQFKPLPVVGLCVLGAQLCQALPTKNVDGPQDIDQINVEGGKEVDVALPFSHEIPPEPQPDYVLPNGGRYPPHPKGYPWYCPDYFPMGPEFVPEHKPTPPLRPPYQGYWPWHCWRPDSEYRPFNRLIAPRPKPTPAWTPIRPPTPPTPPSWASGIPGESPHSPISTQAKRDEVEESGAEIFDIVLEVDDDFSSPSATMKQPGNFQIQRQKSWPWDPVPKPTWVPPPPNWQPSGYIYQSDSGKVDCTWTPWQCQQNYEDCMHKTHGHHAHFEGYPSYDQCGDTMKWLD